MIFAKAFEKNYTTEFFRINHVVRRFSQPVHETEDLQKTHIEGQFYNEELTPVKITEKMMYKTDNIVDTRIKTTFRNT
jgi:hypothetical protein